VDFPFNPTSIYYLYTNRSLDSTKKRERGSNRDLVLQQKEEKRVNNLVTHAKTVVAAALKRISNSNQLWSSLLQNPFLAKLIAEKLEKENRAEFSVNPLENVNHNDLYASAPTPNSPLSNNTAPNSPFAENLNLRTFSFASKGSKGTGSPLPPGIKQESPLPPGIEQGSPLPPVNVNVNGNNEKPIAFDNRRRVSIASIVRIKTQLLPYRKRKMEAIRSAAINLAQNSNKVNETIRKASLCWRIVTPTCETDEKEKEKEKEKREVSLSVSVSDSTPNRGLEEENNANNKLKNPSKENNTNNHNTQNLKLRSDSQILEAMDHFWNSMLGNQLAHNKKTPENINIIFFFKTTIRG